MSGLSKFLFGAAVTGAAAYGVYSFLQKYRVEIKPIDEEKDSASSDDSVDAEFEEVKTETEKAGEDTEKASGSAGKAFDPGKIFDPDRAAAAADTIKNAANRAYTTIQHGSQQAADVVRDTVVPKGTEVVDRVKDTVDTMIPKGAEVVDKVKDTVIPKGAEVIDKVKEAIQGKADSEASEKEDAGAETGTEIPIETPEEEKASEAEKAEGPEKADEVEKAENAEEDPESDNAETPENDEEKKEESAPAADTVSDAAEKTETFVSEEEKPEDSEKPGEDSPKEGTIEFFDDEG